MKIRFLDKQPRVEDRDGAFVIEVLRHAGGPTSSDKILAWRAGNEVSDPPFQIVVRADESTIATLFCHEGFGTRAEAERAMLTGLEIVDHPDVSSYARRCLSAKKAELVV